MDIRDELGDMILQVVFLAQIYSELQEFDIAEVAHAINSKLIRRHPHVFADASHENHAQRWEEIKHLERTERGAGHTLADRIPNTLPALKKAAKVAKKIAAEPPKIKIDEILDSYSLLSQLIDEKTASQSELEKLLAEILFTTTELTSALKVDAEDLLRKKTLQVIAEIDAK